MKKILFFALLIVLSCSKDEGSVDCIYQHTLETSEAINITDTSAILNGSIVVTSDNCNITPGAQRGFVYSNNNQPNINDNLIDLEVFVNEKSTGQFNVGLSLGTLDGATFVSGLNEQNIGGTGRNLNLSINTSSKNTLYSVDVKEPYVLNRKLSLIYGLNYKEYDLSSSKSYNVNILESKGGFKYEFYDDLFHTIMLKLNLKDYSVTNSETVESAIAKSEGNNTEISILNGFFYDNLDSFMRPTLGTSIAFDSIVSPTTSSDNGYFKNILIHKQYFSFSKNILSFQTKIGNIFSFQNSEILSDEKFSLGGRWLRGFDTDGAGPRNSASSYIGGNNIITSTLLSRRHIELES